MMRAISPLKSIGGFPQRVMGFDTETHADVADALIQRQRLTLGWSSFQDFRSMQSPESKEFRSASEFWDEVESRTVPTDAARFKINDENMLYVVAHNAGYDMMVLETERELEARGWELAEAPVYPRPLYLEFIRDGHRFVLMNLANFYGMIPLAKIGKALGFPKGEPSGCGTCKHCVKGNAVICPMYRPENGCVPGSAAWEDMTTYCQRDTEIVVKAMREWNRFCQINQCGPFRFTAAGQAQAAFRFNDVADPKHDAENAIFPPDNPRVQKLERDSYHGGLTDVWRRGEFNHADLDDRHKVDGTGFKKVDVNSMHPSQMATQLYPKKMIAYASNQMLRSLSPEARVAKLTSALNQGFGVVARVIIDTSRVSSPDVRWLATAPTNRDGKLIYPVGRFESVLTTREAEVCLKVGTVADVVEIAVYEMADLFSGYIARFNALKVKYSKEGNEVFRQISKMFLNNLYGKFGQMNPVSVDVGEEMEAELLRDMRASGKHEDVYKGPEDEKITVKRFMGHISVSKGDREEGSSSFCAIAAHIVADSRVKILELRALAGYDEAYYADTDSLIVTEVGFRNLEDAGVIDDTELGKLALEEESQEIRIAAPKDYTFNDHTKRKGVSAKAEIVGYALGRAANGEFMDRRDERFEGSFPIFRQVAFRSMTGAERAGDLNTAVITLVEKIATGAYNKGEVNPESGWVHPFEILD